MSKGNDAVRVGAVPGACPECGHGWRFHSGVDADRYCLTGDEPWGTCDCEQVKCGVPGCDGAGWITTAGRSRCGRHLAIVVATPAPLTPEKP